MFKKTLNEGQAGDNVGLLLRGIKREDVLRGQVCLQPARLHVIAASCLLQLDSMQQRSQSLTSLQWRYRASSVNKVQHAECATRVGKEVIADGKGIKEGGLLAPCLRDGRQGPDHLPIDPTSQHCAGLTGFPAFMTLRPDEILLQYSLVSPAVRPCCGAITQHCCRVYLQLVLLWGWTACMPDSTHVQVVCKPNTIKPYKKFEGEIYALKKDEGGRHTPFFSNYKPQFFFRTADITGQPCMALWA